MSNSLVYFAGLNHILVALDTRTGAVRWEARAGAGADPPPGRNVLVVGGNVIMADNALYAFDRSTGQRRWTYLPSSGDMPGRFAISTDGVRIFTGSPAGYAYALDASTGAPIWITELASDDITVVFSPVVDRGLVVVTMRHSTNPATGGVVALDAVTGAVRWKRDFPQTAPLRGSGSQGRAGFWHELVIAASDDGTIYAMNRETGDLAWTCPRPIDEPAFDDPRPLAVVGDVVVAGSDRQVITGIDAATGTERWRTPSSFGSVPYEIGSDGTRAYIVYIGLQLSAIDAASGDIVWTSGTRGVGQYTPYPVVAGDQLFVGGLGGYYALRR